MFAAILAGSTLLAPALAPEAMPDGYGSALLRMLAALVVVCVLAYLLLRFGLRRLVAPRGAAQHLRVVERCALSTGKALWVVEVGRRKFLLGSAEQGVNLLAELEAGDLRAPASGPVSASAPKRGFSEVLAQALRREVKVAAVEPAAPVEGKAGAGDVDGHSVDGHDDGGAP